MTHDRVDTRRMIRTLACWHTNRMGTPDIWFALQCVEIGLQRRPGNQKRISRRICWSGAQDCIWCSFGSDQRLLLKNTFLSGSPRTLRRSLHLKSCSTCPRHTICTLSCHRWRTCPHHKQCSRRPPWCSLGQRRSRHRPAHRCLLTFACPRHKHYTRFGLFQYLYISRMCNLCSLTSWTPR